MNRKRKRTPRQAMELLARIEGVSVETIRREIERVIRLGFLNPDPQVREYWNRMPCKGEMPTPEEVAEHLTQELESRNRTARRAQRESDSGPVHFQ